MAHTKLPCPACKQVHRYRAADDICMDCRHKLLAFEELQKRFFEQLERPKSPYVLVRHEEAPHWLALPRGWVDSELDDNNLRERYIQIMHELPRLVGVRLASNNRDRNNSYPVWSYSVFDFIRPPKSKDELQFGERKINDHLPAGSASVYDNVPAFPVRHGTYVQFPMLPSQGGSASTEVLLMDVRVRDLLNELNQLVALWVYQSELTGRKQSKNILVQLANGEITVDELQQEDLRLAQAVQQLPLQTKMLKNAKRGKKAFRDKEGR